MDEPVFIFSAGPRSGSTLLQRLILSSKEVLMWGETAAAINHITEALRLQDLNLRHSGGVLSFKKFLDSKEPTKEWIANMQPPFSHTIACYSNMLMQMYGLPAKKMGYPRWGVKEVRCDLMTYEVLRNIFPKAKFVFLVRHPLHALRSIKQRNYNFADRYGRKLPENQLLHFANNWVSLANDYKQIKGCFLIKYEDLCQKNFSSTELCNYLGIKTIDMKLILGDRVDWEPEDDSQELTKEELKLVLPVLKPTMDIYSYQ
jgi:hypothetical protein